MTLAEIVERARRGDEYAFNELYARFRDNAHARAYAVLRDHQRAEDVVQESFAEAYRCLDNLRDPAAFPGWFKRIVIKHIDRVTRVKRRDTVSLQASGADDPVSPEPDYGAEQETLARALRSLPDHEREVAEPFYLRSTPQRDISEELGIPVGTIKKRLFTARARLRKQLADLDDAIDGLDRVQTDFEQFVTAITAHFPNRTAELLRRSPAIAKSETGDGLDILLAAIDAGHRHGDQSIAQQIELYRDDVSPHALAGLGRDGPLRHLLARVPARVHETDAWGRHPLHWAAAGGHSASVDTLLQAQASVNATDFWGCTPLHLAAEHGHRETVRHLIRAGANPLARLRNGKSAAHVAAQSGDLDLLRELAGHGVAVDLFAAARAGSPELVAAFLKRDPNLVTRRLPYGANALHLAAEGRHHETARVLIESGATLDLVTAAELGWLDALEDLLHQQPYAVNERGGSYGFTPLHSASTRGDREAARLLLARGAKTDAIDRMYRKTPLAEALYYGKEALARLLSAHDTQA